MLLIVALTLLQSLGPQSPDGPPDTNFPVLVWRTEFSGQPMPEELVRDFGGVNVEGADPATWARERHLDYYVGHAPGRNDLHIDAQSEWYNNLWQAYWTSREPGLLLRRPCLSERSTRQALLARLERSAKARAGEHGLGLSLGDEVSLTRWGAPLDLCASPACLKAYRHFLATQPKWQHLLPEPDAALPFPDTDITRLAWVDGDARHVSAWLARRDFHHRVLTDSLRELAEAARSLAPGTPIGLFGQSGRTAFGDVGVEEVLPFLDFLEVYRLRDSRELLYSLRKPKQRSYLTVFLDAQAPNGAAWVAWEHWLRGGDGLVVWSDHDLLAQPTQHARLARAVRDLRRVKAECGDWSPRPSRVALIHSPDSLALSWLRDALNDGPTWMRRFASYQNDHGTREVLLDAVLRLLEDSAVLPGALPLASIGKETPQTFPTLVAAELLIVSSEEAARLRAHLDGGGRLLVLGNFSRFDRRGEPAQGNLFDELQRLYPGRVLRFELNARRYLTERLQTPSNYADERRAALAPLLPPSRGPTWAVRTTQSSPNWLQAEQFEPETGSWLCAALPNTQTAQARRALGDLQVRVEHASDFELEWLHPQAPAIEPPSTGQALKAGDALVFRLRPAQ